MRGFPVLIGTYAGHPENGIRAGFLDAASGILLLEPAYAAPNPSWLCATVDGRRLYAVVETDVWADRTQGAIAEYEILAGGDETPPALRRRACVPVPSSGPCHALLHGSRLIVCGYAGGIVTSLPLDGAGDDASATSAASAVDAELDPTGCQPACAAQAPLVRPVHDGHVDDGHVDDGQTKGRPAVVSHAHQAIATPDGQHLALVDLGQDAVFLVAAERLAAAGAISLAAPPFPVSRLDFPAGCGPRHLTFSQDGRHAYLCGEYDNHLYTMAYDGGALRIQSRIPVLPADFGPSSASYCAAVRLSPDGRFVLVSNRGHDSISVFPLEEDGQPGLPGHFACGGHWPRDIAFSPDGRHLLCANQRSHLVTVFAWDASEGSLDLVAATPCDSPTAVLFLQDDGDSVRSGV